jgi:hypothetical protein
MIFYSKERKLSFVTIAKNGSETVTKILKDDFKKVNTPQHTQIVIIREPVSRWISGIVEQALYGPHPKPQQSIKSMLQSSKLKLQSQSISHVDFHTEPQVNFLYKLPTVYYYMTPDVFERINEDHNIFKNIEHHHNSQANQQRREYTHALHEWVKANKDQVHAWLQEVYKDDYKLINNSKFVNR